MVQRQFLTRPSLEARARRELGSSATQRRIDRMTRIMLNPSLSQFEKQARLRAIVRESQIERLLGQSHNGNPEGKVSMEGQFIRQRVADPASLRRQGFTRFRTLKQDGHRVIIAAKGPVATGQTRTQAILHPLSERRRFQGHVQRVEIGRSGSGWTMEVPVDKSKPVELTLPKQGLPRVVRTQLRGRRFRFS